MKYFWLCLMYIIPLKEMCAQNTATNIQGSVRNGETNLPVAGASVHTHESGLYTLTDSLGNFELTNVHFGRHHLHVECPGFVAEAFDVVVDSLEINPIQIILWPTQFEMRQVVIEIDAMREDQLRSTTEVTNLRGNKLDAIRGITLSQTLSSVPGVNSLNTGVSISKPVIRGLSSNRLLVSDQGLKQEGQQWGSDHGLEIDQFGIDRIEVIKGPSSLLYGSDAIGGVINLLPSPPPPHGIRTELQSMWRSVNDYIGNSISLQASDGKTFFSGRVSMAEYSDYNVPVDSFTYLKRILPLFEQRLKNTAGSELHFSGSLGRITKWGNARITASAFQQDAGLFPGIVGIPTGGSVADDGDARNTDLPMQRISHYKVSTNVVWLGRRGRINLDAGYQRNVRVENSKPHSDGIAPMPTSNEAHHLTLQTLQCNVRWHSEVWRKWEFTPGFSGQIQQNKRGGYEFLLPDHSSVQTGIFAIAQRTTEKRSVSTGLRYDLGMIETKVYNQLIYDSEGIADSVWTRVHPVSSRFHNFSGSIGISIWNAARSVNYKLNAGKSFRIPVAAELASNGIHHGSFRHEMGDANLRSESGYQLDLLVSVERKNRNFKISPYFNFFDGYIYLRPSAEFSTLPEGGQVYRYTQHDAIFTGSELTAEWKPVSSAQISFNADYVFSYNLQTGLSLPFTPPLRARISLVYRIQPKKSNCGYFNFSVSTMAVSRQFMTDRNEKPTNGYFISEALVSWFLPVGKNELQLNFSVNNIFDSRYMNHLSVYRQLNLPEPGRNFNVSLRLPLVILSPKNNN